MGVYQLSGMGRSLGAVTVPLTYVYLLLHHAEKGNNTAVDFLEPPESGTKIKKVPPSISSCLLPKKSSNKPSREKSRVIK